MRPRELALSAWMAIGIALVPACTPGTPAPRADSSRSAVGTLQHQDSPRNRTPVPHAHWEMRSVTDALRGAGVFTGSARSTQQAFMQVAATVLPVSMAAQGRSDSAVRDTGGSEVQVYLYEDSAARAKDSDPLDPVRVAPPTMMISWVAPPSLIVDDNLAAILLTRDAALRDRIRTALTRRP